MTALAMIIGMAPMALGLGEGGEQNAPLGRAVVGGLVFATIAVNSCRTLTLTSSSAHPVDIVRIFRMAEEPGPALVATPYEAQKTVLDQTLRSKRQGSILRAILHRWYGQGVQKAF